MPRQGGNAGNGAMAGLINAEDILSNSRTLLMEMDECKEKWTRLFEEYRGQLLRLAKRNIPPVMRRRIDEEDALQMALVAAMSRIGFLENNPEVPPYVKLRMILLQTVTDQIRRHLMCQKRNLNDEVEINDAPGTQTEAQLNWNMLADSISSPASKIGREERHALVRQAIDELPENDRQIIQLRNFDGMSNAECANILNLEQKTASIRYVRALQRLRDKLVQLSEFRQ